MSPEYALIGLTRSVTYDYGRYNVRLNAICSVPLKREYRRADIDLLLAHT